MISQRQTIEDAMIEEIRAKLLQSQNPATGYLALVDRYNGELEPDEEAMDDFRQKIMGHFPAVLVGASGATFEKESTSRRRFGREMAVEVFACSDNLRSPESRLPVDPMNKANRTRDLGIYNLTESLHRIIAGNDFDIEGVGPATPIREEPLIRQREFTVWRLVYEFKADAHIEPWETGDGQFLTEYFLKSQIAGEPGDAPDVSPNPLVESEGDIPS